MKPSVLASSQCRPMIGRPASSACRRSVAPLVRGHVGDQRGKRERGDLQAGVADFAAGGADAGVVPALERLVADGVAHGGQGSVTVRGRSATGQRSAVDRCSPARDRSLRDGINSAGVVTAVAVDVGDDVLVLLEHRPVGRAVRLRPRGRARRAGSGRLWADHAACNRRAGHTIAGGRLVAIPPSLRPVGSLAAGRRCRSTPSSLSGAVTGVLTSVTSTRRFAAAAADDKPWPIGRPASWRIARTGRPGRGSAGR